MISYEGLEKTLKEKGIGKTDLTRRLGISTRMIAKIAKGERLSNRSIQKIADYLGKDPAELMREISDNKILQILREEKELKLSGGLYHELQVRMTYNSKDLPNLQRGWNGIETLSDSQIEDLKLQIKFSLGINV